ncbi:hypothetical protein OIU77_023692 [Salix suchowensis]|uniref:Uncharacterized protein n=1 Tax=Salix suchowensis TaxID=1278906 RepID=A0ABQ9C8Z4_9ROSI|nr:hypothetical protein OIU77_023692 [Salix suchowensis]
MDLSKPDVWLNMIGGGGFVVSSWTARSIHADNPRIHGGTGVVVVRTRFGISQAVEAFFTISTIRQHID